MVAVVCLLWYDFEILLGVTTEGPRYNVLPGLGS